MAVVKVLLENEPINNLEGFTWGLKEGVTPRTSSVLLTNSQANSILAYARNRRKSSFPYLRLDITAEDGSGSKTVSFKNIVVTGYSPSDKEPLNFTRVHLADNRWFWEYGYVDAKFNIKTQVGDKASVDIVSAGVLGNIPRDTYDVYSYRTYSLNPPVSFNKEVTTKAVWTIDEIIYQIFAGDWPQSLKTQLNPLAVQISQNDLRSMGVSNQLFEEISLRGNHKTCLSDLLAMIPYVGVYVDYEGSIRFYNKALSGESEILNNTNLPFTAGSVPKFVKNNLARPSHIVFLFDTECEIRFDYDDRGSSGYTSSPPKAEDRTLFNVMPVPLPLLENIEIETPKGTTTITGTKDQYLPFDNVLRALQRKFNNIDLTHDILMRDYVYPAWLYNLKYAAEVLQPTAQWDIILNSLKTHFRRTFRINALWQSKMVNIQDKLVSVFDPTTGAMPPSPVYQNYAYWLTTKGFLANYKINPGHVEVFQNVLIFDEVANPNFLLSGLTPMPSAKVGMLNSENGIFQVQLEAFDPAGFIQRQVFPSLIDNPPMHDFSYALAPKYLDEADAEGKFPKLSSRHHMTTILSASPAPSIATAYFNIIVSPRDIPTDKVNPSLISQSEGPPLYIKVDSKRAVCRIRWEDTNAQGETLAPYYEKLFGVGDIQPSFPFEALKNQIVNLNYLKEYAIAKATEIYSKSIDRFKGSKITTIDSIEPKGSIDEIPITIGTDGLPSMKIVLNEELRVLSFENLLDPVTKAFLFGQIQKGV